MRWRRKFPNVVMTRTFSKLYGLAGLRIGWMYASEAVCDVINRIRGPFNTSLMQQLVGGCGAEGPRAFLGGGQAQQPLAALDHRGNPQDRP